MIARLRRLGLILRFFAARARVRIQPPPPRVPLAAWNAMFDRSRLPDLEKEKRQLEGFDIALFVALNDPRVIGQIVFEYGTLVNWVSSWAGLRVLDIGSGRSTLPNWMIAQGAKVVSFEFPEPVERRWAGKLGRLNDFLLGAARRRLRQVSGSMVELPFADQSFDLVTSLSVIEHLDTNLPDRSHVPYAEQRKRAACVLDEMVRVTRPGGLIYLTSECCHYGRATTDAWRSSYYYHEGPALSGAWPIEDVPEIFYDYLADRGCSLIGPIVLDPAWPGADAKATFRGPQFSAFSVLARRESAKP
ncbi:MAG: class I SAM-dependent methyltransferase [Candidatus Rokubacteria bacterium]|nr:class I SAM-dependent methyltransferase [Candidatus Rokubacteria bacterium]